MAGTKLHSAPATDVLEVTLQHIKNDLSNLSTDRLAMETKMEGLVYEIQHLASNLYNYRRPLIPQSSPVRRVRSSATPSSKSVVKKHSKSKQYTSIGKELKLTSDSSNPVSSYTNSSTRERSSSASVHCSLEDKGTAKLGNRSFSVEGSWKIKNTIPELPESPSVSSVARYSYCSGASSQDSSYSSIVLRSSKEPSTPLTTQWQTRQHFGSLVTSTPNMQYCGADNENYYTLPGKITASSSQQHQIFSSGNLSEVDGCLDEDLQQQDRSFIIRRSSLTGQLEQFRRPHYKETNTGVVMHRGNAGYKVLNKGVKKTLKRRSTRLDQVILPSVETTV